MGSGAAFTIIVICRLSCKCRGAIRPLPAAGDDTSAIQKQLLDGRKRNTKRRLQRPDKAIPHTLRSGMAESRGVSHRAYLSLGGAGSCIGWGENPRAHRRYLHSSSVQRVANVQQVLHWVEGPANRPLDVSPVAKHL
ncbi:hypothetical protein C8Q77DRAFT_346095 [Trametes polyzona]|nr:hypothetical protein C8Q77DRAFT_346095 [Trametes polyzona]